MGKSKRTDYPLCPWCLSPVALGATPGRPEDWLLYCVSAECRGRSHLGIRNGYDFQLRELTTPVPESARPRRWVRRLWEFASRDR